MADVELNEEELLESDNEIYKCPGCGANLKYNSSIQGLHCDYCGFEMTIDGSASSEEFDLNFDVMGETWNDEVKKADCSNCGATILLEKHVLTAKCPFCNTPMVISTDDIIGLKPNRVIPFKTDQNDVIENYRKWIKKKFFAPRKLKKNLPNPSFYTIYSPSWTFDTNVTAPYQGRLGKRYTRTVGSGKNRHTVTYVRYFRISGVHQKIVDDVVVMSGKKISQKELNMILPYDTNNSFVYDNRYIIGHNAEHYSIDLKEGWKIGKDIIEDTIKREILRKYHYDVVDYLKIMPNYYQSKYKYVILPIWICHYSFRKKDFRFIVNGENGKVYGKTPISIFKVLLLVTLGILIIVLIFLAYVYQ